MKAYTLHPSPPPLLPQTPAAQPPAYDSLLGCTDGMDTTEGAAMASYCPPAPPAPPHSPCSSGSGPAPPAASSGLSPAHEDNVWPEAKHGDALWPEAKQEGERECATPEPSTSAPPPPPPPPQTRKLHNVLADPWMQEPLPPGGLPETPPQQQDTFGPPVKPFDMWSSGGTAPPQEAAAEAGAAGAAAPQLPQLPFKVYVSNDSGGTICWSDVGLLPDVRGYTIEWSERESEGGVGAPVGHYDVEALGTAAEHVSATAARLAAKGVRQPVSLNACVEAFLQPEQLSEEDSW